MPSKSGKWSPKPLSEIAGFRMRLSALTLGALLFPIVALSAPSVSPTAPWSFVEGEAHFATTASAGTLDTAGGFTQKDITATFNGSAFDSDDLIEFDVSETTSVTNPLLIVYAELDNQEFGVMPIATVNGFSCANSSVSCRYTGSELGLAATSEADTFYYATSYTSGTKFRIGFLPKDICTGVKELSGRDSDGCASGGVETTSPAKTTFRLFFAVIADPGSNSSAKTEFQKDKEGSGWTEVVANLYYRNLADGTPAFSCTYTDSYFPGDSLIYLDSSKFSYSGQDSNAPPVPNLVVLANEGAIDTATIRSNDVFSVISSSGGERQISGFINSTGSGSDDHPYNLEIFARDATGFLSTASCSMTDVRTADIEGFLNESKCFIATAAFRSGSAPVVVMLRNFRDRVLLKTTFGQKFVELYYEYSPSAAHWLIKNPAYRGMILLALLPLAIFAWVALNPLLLIPLLFAGMLVLLFAWRERGRTGTSSVGGLSLTVLALGLVFSSSAKAESNQPYIDSIKAGMKKEDTAQPEGSYIEELRRKLDKEENVSQPSSESYTETLRRRLSAGDGKAEPSYSEGLKKELGASPAGSAIEDLKSGKSELKLKRPGDIHHAFSFRMGASQERSVSLAGAPSFTSVYEDGWAPDLAIFYEFQPWHSEYFGSIGLIGGFGATYKDAFGNFSTDLPKPWDLGSNFSGTSRTKLKFYTVPVMLGLNYRFNLLRIIRPYVHGMPALIGYIENRSDDGASKRGYSTGYVVGGGVNIPLDFLSRKSAWSLYDDHGIKKFYLTLDYSRMETLSGDVEFSTSGISAGFTFEL